MTKRDWVLVLSVIGIGIVLQIPGMKAVTPVAEAGSTPHAQADLPPKGKVVSLAVTGMT